MRVAAAGFKVLVSFRLPLHALPFPGSPFGWHLSGCETPRLPVLSSIGRAEEEWRPDLRGGRLLHATMYCLGSLAIASLFEILTVLHSHDAFVR